jgi:hypothetical protein
MNSPGARFWSTAIPPNVDITRVARLWRTVLRLHTRYANHGYDLKDHCHPLLSQRKLLPPREPADFGVSGNSTPAPVLTLKTESLMDNGASGVNWRCSVGNRLVTAGNLTHVLEKER